ncbi:MAG: helix-turn-helix domain-containing protein [Clostridia bacterium]|nr:helix-turn-helix domain-containing protein [Clostridia bacterium]
MARTNEKEEKLVRLTPCDLAHERFYGRSVPVMFKKDIMHPYRQSVHMHDFVQLWYCISGKCKNVVGKESYPLKAGSLVIVPCGVEHSLVVEEDAELFSFSISPLTFLKFDPAACSHLAAYTLMPAFCDENSPFATRSIALSEESQNRFCNMFSRLSINNDFNFKNLLFQINELFLLPELLVKEGEMESALNVIEKQIVPIIRAVSYINSNFADKITTRDLLRESFLCQTTFFSLFKQFMGMRSSTYIQRLRTSHAIFYLSHTSYDISKVSDCCGFNTPSHFVMCHKKHTGLLPKYLRTRLKMYYEKNPEIKVKKPNPFE